MAEVQEGDEVRSGMAVVDVVEDDPELVAAEPGDGVARSERAGQPLADGRQIVWVVVPDLQRQHGRQLDLLTNALLRLGNEFNNLRQGGALTYFGRLYNQRTIGIYGGAKHCVARFFIGGN